MASRLSSGIAGRPPCMLAARAHVAEARGEVVVRVVGREHARVGAAAANSDHRSRRGPSAAAAAAARSRG